MTEPALACPGVALRDTCTGPRECFDVIKSLGGDRETTKVMHSLDWASGVRGPEVSLQRRWLVELEWQGESVRIGEAQMGGTLARTVDLPKVEKIVVSRLLQRSGFHLILFD